MSSVSKIIEMLNHSHSSFGAIKTIKKELEDHGYQRLVEGELANVQEGGKYYVTRNQSSIIAFRIPYESIGLDGFHVAASHSDSPSFKVKPNPITVSCGMMQLQTEPYGGGIYHSWLDRPLSLSGRVMVESGNDIRSVIVDLDEDLLTIPSVCIHFDRAVNEGRAFNPKTDMIPVIGQFQEGFDFYQWLGEKIGIDDKEKVLSYDLYLYVREDARLVGMNKELLQSPREDNLTSAFASLLGFLNADNDKNNISKSIPVYACFDNEEVGSLTRQGANSTFLKDVLTRICRDMSWDYEASLARSFMLSIDNAHANHPNHPELSGSNVILNGGVVLKYNANQKYTTDALSAALVKSIANDWGLNIQEFTNRADIRGGSTLGNISNSEVSMVSADIGIAQLAMHSSVETLGVSDLEDMVSLTEGYYESTFNFDEDDHIHF